MRTRLWVMTVAVAGAVAFLLGYAISSQTGVEPGYFEAAETGGYGVPSKDTGGQALEGKMKDYYRNLSED